MLFQFVARFGSNKDIDPSLIKVDPGQAPKIGLGYLSSVEPLNEPDGTWLGRESYFSPFELAAFLSMCYDGHEGMYKNAGVKQADPNFKMSMSGGAGLNLGYLRAMAFWSLRQAGNPPLRTHYSAYGRDPYSLCRRYLGQKLSCL